MLADAIAFAERVGPLPRCKHGNALRDGAGELLEPSCGCKPSPFANRAAAPAEAEKRASNVLPDDWLERGAKAIGVLHGTAQPVAAPAESENPWHGDRWNPEQGMPEDEE